MANKEYFGGQAREPSERTEKFVRRLQRLLEVYLSHYPDDQFVLRGRFGKWSCMLFVTRVDRASVKENPDAPPPTLQ